jgi:hypothetical protein
MDEMKRNGINISINCLDILKRIWTKLMVSGDMRWNLFHHISFCSAPFHSIIIFEIQTMKSYYIPFHSAPFHYIPSIQIKRQWMSVVNKGKPQIWKTSKIITMFSPPLKYTIVYFKSIAKLPKKKNQKLRNLFKAIHFLLTFSPSFLLSFSPLIENIYLKLLSNSSPTLKSTNK